MRGPEGPWDSTFNSRSVGGLPLKTRGCGSSDMSITRGVTAKTGICLTLVPTDTVPELHFPCNHMKNFPHLEAIFSFSLAYALLSFSEKSLIHLQSSCLADESGFLLFSSPYPGPVGFADLQCTHNTHVCPGRRPGTRECHFLVPAKLAKPLQKTSCFCSTSEMRTVGFLFYS